MMECPGWEILATPESWSEEVRTHVDACEACTAWRREHAAFLAEDPALTTVERERALDRLSAFTRELVGVGAPEAKPAPAGSFFERLRSAFAAPPLRLAGALAAVAIVSAVVVARREPTGARVGEATRGAVADAMASVSPGADGSCVVTWPGIEGADGYRVELLDAGLAVAGAESTVATTCTFDSTRAAAAAYARVVAMRQGDRLRELAPVPIPRR